MTERPILFSAPMVRSILVGTKTQTRRVVKPPPSDKAVMPAAWPKANLWGNVPMADGSWGDMRCPYGVPGDRLWVREAWRTLNVHDHVPPRELTGAKVSYDADTMRTQPSMWWGKGRPSIHMPRWASRITLEVTGVRVERLQAISIADAMAEGVVEVNANLRGLEPCMEWRYAYEDLWESINGAGSWDANPFVWVVEFRRA